ncbi:MAG: cysteine hydrolase [bacterium]|nr:cysteine hydrolase [bacterium]
MKYQLKLLLTSVIIAANVFFLNFTSDIPEDTALLLIDIQYFYFPGGRSELEGPIEASLQAKKILDRFREKGLDVIHVRHSSQQEADIHPNVEPVSGEKVITKTEISCFNGTDLLDHLKQKNIKNLVICGMMTHMCVEAAVRTAHDMGFECILIEDACATRDLTYQERTISAEDVHISTLNTLNRRYAEVIDTKTFLSKYDK